MTSSPSRVCYYSVIRYVPDPVRNEPRNIGALVVCPDTGVARARFSLNRASLAPSSPRYLFLRSFLAGYNFEVVHEADAELSAHAPSTFDLARLKALHSESTNLIQFTDPLPSPGEPEQTLADVYRDFVSPRHTAGGGWSRSVALNIFKRCFRQRGIEGWVQDSATVSVDEQPPYVFDFGIRNGTWRAVIEVASFKLQDPQKPEERAAWMAYAWQDASKCLDARALLFVERGPRDDADKRMKRITGWASDAGIEIHDAESVADIAKGMADEMARPHPEQMHLVPTS